MFNTISKQCLLCLRLVSYGASLLWSGFIRGGVARLCLCASQLLSLPLLLLGSTVNVCWRRCALRYSTLKQYTSVRILPPVLHCSLKSLVLSPIR